jgi:type IV pilus assembly protein PilC
VQQYTYKAKDADGKVIQAEIEAVSVADAAKVLKSKQLFPFEIEPRKTGLLSGDFSMEFSRLTAKDRVLFTRQLSTLIKAGLPLAKGLRVLTGQIDNPKLLRMVNQISTSIEGGSTLSQSLAQNPKFFNGIYISMVESGETSGNLDEVLIRLADQEEKTQEINRKIRGALTYPAVVLAVLVAVSVLMITMVLPQVGKMYTDLNKPLPVFTEMLLALAAFMTKFWYFILMLLGAIAYSVKLYLASPAGRNQFDKYKMKLPLFGPLMKKLYMARFARTMGSLVASGVPMLQALDIVSRAMNNMHLERAIKAIQSQVKAGSALSKPISENELFLPLVGQMLSVGEETGSVSDSLNKVADYYEDEVDQAVATISTLIEPATMVILGLMVAFLIGAVLLPIYGLVSGLGG